MVQAVLALATTLLAIASQHKHKRSSFYDRNLNTVQAIYDLTVFPKEEQRRSKEANDKRKDNIPIRTNGSSAVPAGLFAATASGRVTPLGNFSGFEDSIEYFFALAPVPLPPLYGVFKGAPVVEFTSGCPEVAASVVYLEQYVLNDTLATNGQYINSLKQIAFWRFDDMGAVIAYDAWIRNLNLWTALTFGYSEDLFSYPQVQAAGIAGLCGAVQERCVGANQQYPKSVPIPLSEEHFGVSTCIETLSAKSYGSYDETWGDNVVCRAVHAQLTPLRPEVHCPHVGPTGGAKCAAESYDDAYFASDQRLFGAPQGQTFACPCEEDEDEYEYEDEDEGECEDED
ncbi:hypothetical protein LSUE1_G008135 [Lachnellula suecica]|uniref:Uncharacterized protein n=1 Tax=Lachnellula suecica TaxID=602035 RepID=A0A8T9BUB4_9HELO|nr:hypothetical protein LSUE1_G008135 [Lachnellula suecica]